VGRADGHASLSVERRWHDPASLVERDGHGHADRAQGRHRRREVIAATLLDLLQSSALREDAVRYFRDEQLRGTPYEPFIGPDDTPPAEKNAAIMAEFKERLRELYYDPAKHDTYLEQLGVDYPQLEKPL
jgi:hypothetical protein